MSRRSGSKRGVFRLQRGLCAYCGCSMHLENDGTDEQATWDEVIPRSRGGLRIRSNTVLACRSCNHRKGSDLWETLPTIRLREDRVYAYDHE